MAYMVGWGVFGAVIAMLFEVSVVSAAWGFLIGAVAYLVIFIAILMVGYGWFAHLKSKF